MITTATWVGIGTALWCAGAIACLLGAAWLLNRRHRFGTARPALAAALAFSGIWTLVGVVEGIGAPLTAVAENLRNLAWLFALYRLFAIDGRDASMRPVRPMLLVLTFVELLQIVNIAVLFERPIAPLGLQAWTLLHLLVAIGSLVLVHNLYGGASQQARLALRWPALSLAVLWTVDLNHYAIAYLSDGQPLVTAALRGLLGIPIAGLLVMGAGERSEKLRFGPSRAATFQSLSLLLIGGYLIAMVITAQGLAFAGRDYATLLQIALVAISSLVVVALVTSQRLRGWLRVSLIKHLFQHRYDYRAEWLRFTKTIGQEGPQSPSLNERIIRALADVADSPAGLLLVAGENGQLELAARWHWPTAEVPGTAICAAQARRFELIGYIVDLDAVRGSPNPSFEVPDWLLADPKAWVLVPLLHFDRLAGMVVLARPAYVRRLDWEDFDLFKVVGRQLASYLAEHAGQDALAEAGRFDEFNRRIAFVMHDIKNLASQMGLLARNAEQHADNPEFRADMLVTLRNSTDKLNGLVARLSRYGTTLVENLVPVQAEEVACSVIAQLKSRHPVTLVEAADCEISAHRESLEQVLIHLVQNAIEASAPEAPVFVSVSTDGVNGQFEVVDSGTGMSPDFVRNRLFKPFDSTKPGGFGIGAYEARELVRSMRGQLEVESREGLGTRFAVILPLAEAAAIIETINEAGKTGSKVA